MILSFGYERYVSMYNEQTWHMSYFSINFSFRCFDAIWQFLDVEKNILYI